MIYIKNPSSLRFQYMIPQRINEIKVVNTNFKNISGFLDFTTLPLTEPSQLELTLKIYTMSSLLPLQNQE